MATKAEARMRRALRVGAKAVAATDPELAATMKEAAKKRGPGGKQPGAGRPTIYAGGTRQKVSVRLTDTALAIIEATRRELELEYGHAATTAASVEFLVRKAGGRKGM